MRTQAIGQAFALALVLGCAAQPDDEKIVRAVEQSLGAETNLRDYPIEAASRKGEVTLSGDVRSAAERIRASEIAEAVAGVVKVENLITVTSPPAELPQVAAPPPSDTIAAPETPPAAIPSTPEDGGPPTQP